MPFCSMLHHSCSRREFVLIARSKENPFWILIRNMCPLQCRSVPCCMIQSMELIISELFWLRTWKIGLCREHFFYFEKKWSLSWPTQFVAIMSTSLFIYSSHFVCVWIVRYMSSFARTMRPYGRRPVPCAAAALCSGDRRLQFAN